MPKTPTTARQVRTCYSPWQCVLRTAPADQVLAAAGHWEAGLDGLLALAAGSEEDPAWEGRCQQAAASFEATIREMDGVEVDVEDVRGTMALLWREVASGRQVGWRGVSYHTCFGG